MVKNEYLITFARKFAEEHKSVIKIYDNYRNDKDLVCFDIDVKVNLPSSYKVKSQTDKGVKDLEKVTLEFPKEFPYKAPKVYLRDDFNRNFPHINPITDKFNPCIFEGSVDELLQQPLWMDGILDQLIDWLETSASNSLINPVQGWEPMRVDDNNGFLVYDRENLLSNCKENFATEISYKKLEKILIARVPKIENENFKNSYMFCFSSNKVSDEYMPNSINNFVKLVEFTKQNNIDYFKESINKNFEQLIKEKVQILFLSLFIKRPYTVIGTYSDMEILHFALELKKHKKKKNGVHQNANVSILSGLNFSDTKLLQQFSGANQVTKENQVIMQIGCGSLGSKIALHLARNGNDNFKLIDEKYFVPNNNARHALFSSSSLNLKVELLQKAMQEIGLNNVNSISKNIFDIGDFKTTDGDIIIDSTASLSVNNYLTKKEFEGRLIHTSLYNNGTIAFIGVEGKNREVKIIDIISLMYQKCTEDNEIAKRITDTHATYQSLGQGCGSFTTISSDATISISSAGMSNLIQSKIDNGFSDNGEFLLGIMDEHSLGMSWKTTDIKPLSVKSIKGPQGEDWEIRIFQNVLDEINIESKKWNDLETGGILIGHISIPTQTIVITGQIEAPQDSERGKSKFYSGVKCLSDKLKSIEKSSAEMITQLGTWHSHPNSSSNPSSIDLDSKKRMYKDRNWMPTVCLIWSKNSVSVY
jgi:integrative and conjugative element protein (TIGR02256 family)